MSTRRRGSSGAAVIKAGHTMGFNRKLFMAAIAAAIYFADGAAMAKEKPEEVCRNQLLTYRQRYMCQQELDNIETKAQQKAIVRKYTDLIRAAEKAQAEK